VKLNNSDKWCVTINTKHLAQNKALSLTITSLKQKPIKRELQRSTDYSIKIKNI